MSIMNAFRGYNPFRNPSTNNRKLTKARRGQKDRNTYKGSQMEADHVFIEKRCKEADRCVSIYQNRLNQNIGDKQTNTNKRNEWMESLNYWLVLAEEALPFRRLKELNGELINA